MSARAAFFPAAASLLAMLLVACGGSGDGDVAADDAEATPTAQESPVDTATEAPEADDAASGAFAIDACTLLTADEVATATGTTAQEGVFNADLTSDQQSICEWQIDASGVAFVQVVVNETSAVDQRSTAEEFLGPAADAEVAGASDGYLVGGIVGAQAGPYFVQVTVAPADDDAAVQLAGQAVAALG